MCLIIKTGCKPQVAEEPILVHKQVLVGKDDNRSWWVSPYRHRGRTNEFGVEIHAEVPRGFTYEKLKHLKPISDNLEYKIIKEGLHAYAMLTNDMVRYIIRQGFCVVPAIIPPGTEYCLGQDNDIVATRMIVCEDECQLRKLLKDHGWFDPSYHQLQNITPVKITK